MRNGYGILEHGNGKKEQGAWKDGKLVE